MKKWSLFVVLLFVVLAFSACTAAVPAPSAAPAADQATEAAPVRRPLQPLAVSLSCLASSPLLPLIPAMRVSSRGQLRRRQSWGGT